MWVTIKNHKHCGKLCLPWVSLQKFLSRRLKTKPAKSSIKWYPWLLADSMVYELGINYMVKQFFNVSEGAVIQILLRNSKREEWSRQLSGSEFKIFIAKNLHQKFFIIGGEFCQDSISQWQPCSEFSLEFIMGHTRYGQGN